MTMNFDKLHLNQGAEKSIQWRLEGPFDSSYSLALLNREIARAMKSQGVEVALYSTEGPGDFEPSAAFLEANQDLAAMWHKSAHMSQNTADVTSRNLYPPRVNDMKCATNLMHSYAWEETGFPAEWVRSFNRHLTGLTCLSTHVLKVMQDNGVDLPMVVSGCGVDHWERVLATDSSVLDETNSKSFKFLHVSSFFPRKGPEALLEAYGTAFTKSDDVTLVIKTFPNPHNQVHDLLGRMQTKYPAYPHVVVVETDLSDSNLKSLYQECDVLVAPSCAEGFGLPLAEAMLSGLPVITTGWSGQTDFCTSDNSWLVDFCFEQANTHFNLLPSAWAAIDKDALASAMKAAHATDPLIRSQMAGKGRSLLLQEFSWGKVSQRLVDFYTKLKACSDSSPRFGLISTWNVKCGIATYSKHLTMGMKNQPVVLAAKNSNRLQADGSNVIRCWETRDDDTLEELCFAIDNKNLNVLLIQFNFGFFDHNAFYKFLLKQKSAGRVIVIDMHATTNPPQAPTKMLKNYVPALSLADRLLVHTIADMNRLKAVGVSDNLTLFPHGVIDFPISVSPKAELPTIATYGFCLPHKGLEQVVDAVAQLRDEGFLINLKMVNAEYPVDFSAQMVETLRAKVRELKLEEQVQIEPRFLSDEESLELLNEADLMLFVYHPTSESASGAVRYGLAIKKPILVTDISIFGEFGDAVWRVSSNDKKLLGPAIKDVLEHVRSNSDEFQLKQNLANRWCDQHSYAWLSERLEGLLASLWRSVCRT